MQADETLAVTQNFVAQADGRYWSPQGCIDASQARLLANLRGFAPLRLHVRALASGLGLPDSDAVELQTQLQELQQAGLLQSLDDLLPAEDPGSTRARIQRCYIHSHARPEALQRLLREIGSKAQQDGRELLITDDSRKPQAPINPLSAPLQWIHRQHRRQWIDGIHDKDLRKLAHWALLPADGQRPMTIGSSLNTTSLHAQGQAIACFDDDICAPLGRAIDSEPGHWSLAGEGDPTHLKLYDDIESAIEDLEVHSSHPAALLEQALGENLAHLSRQQNLCIETGAPSQLADALRNNGRVLTSMMGFAGDSGMSSPSWYLGLREDAGHRLDARFASRILSRNVVRAAPHHRLCQSAFFMNACIGLDLRQGLIPFLPHRRNADGLFGRMLARLAPHSLRHYLPWAVSHRPVEARSYQRRDLFLGMQPQAQLVDLLSMAVADWPAPALALDLPAAMTQLGTHLQAMAGWTPAQFETWSREKRLHMLSAQLRWHQDLLGQVRECRHPALKAGIERLRAGLQRIETQPAARCLPEELDAAQTQQQFECFGLLLQAWPLLLQEASARPLSGEMLKPA